ncbi:MAG: amidohydrolase family protein [Sphingomonadales bacterium]|nr:amidohydrolase family protein [Sphingomonadales bacterium]
MKVLKSLALSSFLIIAVSVSTTVYGASYDVVLKGGRVMDPESGLDAVRNVGIKDGKIAAITTAKLNGAREIDVSGLVVAPGFIDIHDHAQDNLGNAFQARDGVTTALEMELGVYPVAAWYQSRAGKAILNYGATVSHGKARLAMLTGSRFRPTNDPDGADAVPAAEFQKAIRTELTDDQIKGMLSNVEEGLRDGGLGIGIGVAYVPGARRTEIFRIFQFARQHHALIFVHGRYGSRIEPDSLDTAQELIANAAATGGAVHLCHIGSTGGMLAMTLLEMIEAAQTRQVNISTEVYPYTASDTWIGAPILDPGWQQRVDITYSDLEWRDTGERLTEETFNKYRAEQPFGKVVAHFMKEEMIRQIVARPGVIIVSDATGFSEGSGHPRTAGTFARVLGRYVREEQVLPLMEALAKMTILPARRLEPFAPAMAHKGRLQKGADADIAVFDPATVIDNATFKNAMQYSTGIKHVLVNGVVVVENEALTPNVFPGKPVRNAVAMP